MDIFIEALLMILPTVVLGLIFWMLMRNIFRMDSNERKAFSKIEAEERAKREKIKEQS